MLAVIRRIQQLMQPFGYTGHLEEDTKNVFEVLFFWYQEDTVI